VTVNVSSEPDGFGAGSPKARLAAAQLASVIWLVEYRTS
jgi:hypothetical protein